MGERFYTPTGLRRRQRQQEYNELHGITPRGVQKAIRDIMEGAYGPNSVRGKLFPKVADKEAEEYLALSPEKLIAKIAQLEKQMYEHAHNLEFEEAARLRDLVKRLQADVIAK
jgi:excinuclease ABC subunit B